MTGAADAVGQGINMAAGNQEEYDLKRTLMAGAVSGITTAGMEAVKSTVYASSGGKEQLLEDKTNRKLIEESVPADKRDQALKAYEDLKKVPNSQLKQEVNKAEKYTGAGGKNNRIHTPKSGLKHIGESKAHALVGSKQGQVAVDVGASATNRGAQRAVFDVVPTENGETSLRYAGYTPDHRYDQTKGFRQNEAAFMRQHQNVEVSLANADRAADYAQRACINNLNDSDEE